MYFGFLVWKTGYFIGLLCSLDCLIYIKHGDHCLAHGGYYIIAHDSYHYLRNQADTPRDPVLQAEERGERESQKALRHWFPKCRGGHTPGNLLEKHILGPYPRFAESETLFVFKTPLSDSDPDLNLRTTGPRNKEKIMASDFHLLDDQQVEADVKSRWEK